MFNQFDDDVFLGPETTVSLHFDDEFGDGTEEWDIGHADAMERVERDAWARHALRASGFVATESDDDDFQGSTRATLGRLVLAWD